MFGFKGVVTKVGHREFWYELYCLENEVWQVVHQGIYTDVDFTEEEAMSLAKMWIPPYHCPLEYIDLTADR